jgi:hypothetical protein
MMVFRSMRAMERLYTIPDRFKARRALLFPNNASIFLAVCRYATSRQVSLL